MASEKVTAIVEELKTLTVLELSELVSAVEEEFVKQQVLDLRKLRKSLITLLRLLRKQFQQLTLKLLRLSLKKLAQRLNSSNSTFKFTFNETSTTIRLCLFFYTPIFSCTVSITLNATPDSANHISENGTQT